MLAQVFIVPRSKVSDSPPYKRAGSADEESQEHKGMERNIKRSKTTPTTADRVDKIRLINQSLRDLGLSDVAATLEEKTGIALESLAMRHLRDLIMQGDWAKAIGAVTTIEMRQAQYNNRVLLALHEQQYLELLLGGDKSAALVYLRTHLPAFESDRNRLHFLAGLVALRDSVAVYAKLCTSSSSTPATSIHELRGNIVQYLTECVSTKYSVPEGRLDTIIGQARHFQHISCSLHNPEQESNGILEDHRCDDSDLPSARLASLEQHSDEVWMVRFSHSGEFLASASRDHTAVIWNCSSLAVAHLLSGHTDAVQYIAWSADDKMVATCGCDDDPTVRIWIAATGVCIKVLDRHTQGVSACVWLPDMSGIISGSTDQSLVRWNMAGESLKEWSKIRTVDMAVTSDSKMLVLACHEHRLRLISLDGSKEEHHVQETHAITSLSLSGDSDHALLSLSCKEIHLWNLTRLELVHKFAGHQQARFAIRSCFGAPGDSCIASGSEDGVVYIWSRASERVVQKLIGHESGVNAVSWHPRDTSVLASGGDDGTVRLWGPVKPLRVSSV